MRTRAFYRYEYSFHVLIMYPYSPLTSPIITMIVGRDQRIFAAHEDVLSVSPFFSSALKEQFLEDGAKQLTLPDE